MNSFSIQIATSLFVAIVTSVLSVHLALRRFYQEKWWERKLNAYLEIMDALHTIRSFGSEWYDQEILRQSKTEEAQKEDWLIFKKAQNDLRRSVSLGELMLSAEAVTILTSCQNRLEGINMIDLGPLDYYGEMLFAADEALTKTRHLLKRDLGLEGRFQWRQLRLSDKGDLLRRAKSLLGLG